MSIKPYITYLSELWVNLILNDIVVTIKVTINVYNVDKNIVLLKYFFLNKPIYLCRYI